MNNLAEYIATKEAEVARVATIRPSKIAANVNYYRSDADIDYARIIYSSAYRRLQGKMQLFIPRSEVFYRNRLTHSHEVAQIAKTLAKKFRMNDIITVQACALAHDIGNPPFGHAGEVVLNTIAPDSPYEGNAQTFRILTEVEEKHFGHAGLNLTIRTLLGTIKYLKSPKGNNKFLYEDDFERVEKWFESNKINHKTIDCEVMDIADEIAYAAHDLEDALKLKYFTIDELIYEFSVSDEFKIALKPITEIVEEAKEFANKAHAYKTSEEYAMLFRKQLTSLIVDRLIDDIGLTESDKLGYISLEALSKGLKTLTFKAIKRQPDIIEYEQLGKHIIEQLFQLYSDSEFNKDMVLLPANYRFEDDIPRMIQDYIGGMTDIYAINQYEKYYGKLDGRGLFFKEKLLEKTEK